MSCPGDSEMNRPGHSSARVESRRRDKMSVVSSIHHPPIPSFIFPTNNYLLRTYSVLPSLVLGTGETTVDQKDMVSVLMNSESSVGDKPGNRQL